MEYRSWMSDELKMTIYKIETCVPDNILNHLFDLMEEMHNEWHTVYHSIIDLLHIACIDKPADFSFVCSDRHLGYDQVHEICYYLEGWVWQIKNIEDAAEDGRLELIPLYSKKGIDIDQ